MGVRRRGPGAVGGRGVEDAGPAAGGEGVYARRVDAGAGHFPLLFFLFSFCFCFLKSPGSFFFPFVPHERKERGGVGLAWLGLKEGFRMEEEGGRERRALQLEPAGKGKLMVRNMVKRKRRENRNERQGESRLQSR